jgi:hypothetical protein
MMMGLLYNYLFWKGHSVENVSRPTSIKTGENDSKIKRKSEEKEFQNSEEPKSPKFEDSTQTQAFWDKAVPS